MQAGNVGRHITVSYNRLQKKQMTPEGLRNHMMSTYKHLRKGMAAIALALPPILWGIGYFWFSLPLQGSMSAYYHSSMRDVFVGALWAVGVFLFLYKGYSKWENFLLNIAGGSAIGVALFPMEWGCGAECKLITLHGTLAAIFFASIALVCIFRATDTLCLIEDVDVRQRYLYRYRTFGVLMIMLPVIVYILVMNLPFPEAQNPAIFFFEAFGIWVFGIYWWVKSREIGKYTDAEAKTLDREVEMVERGLCERE
jgi:hypothetical protein